jgi:hypothetical protein
MNLSPLKNKGFEILTLDEVEFASRKIERDGMPLEFNVYSDGALELVEYFQEAMEDIISLGDVNSPEQAIYVFDVINSINTTGKHEIEEGK